MLLGAFLVPSLAHAGTGVVSVNGGNIVTALKTDTTVSIGIQISGSDPINGFDVQVSADHSILQGASISLAGSVLPSPTVVVECIDGVLIAGSTCAPTDTIGVVHLAASTLGGLTPNPTTGLLFTINYNIVGLTAATPVSFTTGCVGTSVSNGDCVTIANGTHVAVSETDAGAIFANLVDFTMKPAFASVSTASGVPLGVAINYASEGGYNDILSETVSATSGLTATLGTSSVDLSCCTTGSDTVTVSGTTSGSVTVTATGSGFCTCGVITHSATFSVVITPVGFTVALSQSSVTINRGNTDSSTKVSLAGASGFSGTVSLTAVSASGITGSAPMATLTPDASGFSSASSTLTIAVGSGVATGTYTLTLTGMSGASSSSASMSVVVPGFDFSIAAVPAAISIVRGGSVALSLNIVSLGNFAGAASFSAVVTPVAGQQDSCCLTNNIIPAFTPATATLTAGGSLTIAFFASTVGGTAPAASYTATGNYTATLTATIGSVSHSAIVTFNIEDFSVGPGWCNGANAVYTTPNGNNFPVFVNTQCTSLTITDQPNVLTPLIGVGNQVLWVQTNAFGGLITDGFAGTPAIAALNPQSPVNGFTIPQLAQVFPAGYPNKMCLLPTFWANGTQIPYSYLVTHGPLVTPGVGLYAFLSIVDPADFGPGALGNWGCKFDAGAFPNDHGIDELNAFLCSDGDAGDNCTNPFQTINNPDFWGVTAMSIVGTVAGSYTFQLCGQTGIIIHCHTYGLNVLASPFVHQLVVKKSVSFAASGGNVPFKLGISNPDSHTVYAQVTVNGIGNLGDTFTASSNVVTIAPGASANNIQFSVPLIASEIGETFSFSFSISVGTDPNNLDGTSTLQTISQTFTLTA